MLPMASTKCTAIYAAMGVAVVLLLAAAADGSGSFLTMWEGPGCEGQTATAGLCGCSDLQFYGGQEFSFGGQTARLYTGTGCTGTEYLVFEDTQACGDFGWRSINIDC
ncbi:hypothetical protein ACP4OV_011389 [Aristida adscensionis]